MLIRACAPAMVGPDARVDCEPGQVRKEAAISMFSPVPSVARPWAGRRISGRVTKASRNLETYATAFSRSHVPIFILIFVQVEATSGKGTAIAPRGSALLYQARDVEPKGSRILGLFSISIPS